MKEVLKISSLIALLALISFAIWFIILSIYELVATPESFTKFEMFMSALVSIHIGGEFIAFVLKTMKEGAEE